MSERWIPVFAAVVGLLGGVGGAAIGGSIANNGQQDRLSQERQTHLEDVLIETFSKYVGTAGNAYVQLQGGPPENIKGRVVGEVEAAEAQVEFVTSVPEVSDTALALEKLLSDLANDGTVVTYEDYKTARDKFIATAGSSIQP